MENPKLIIATYMMSNSILKTCFNVKVTLLLMRQVYTKSPVFVWEIFPRILGKRPKGILKGCGRMLKAQ
jgi:hypothetical protein